MTSRLNLAKEQQVPIPTTLVLGVGNLLMGDDGVGIHAIELLAGGKLPPNVSVMDAGTPGWATARTTSSPGTAGGCSTRTAASSRSCAGPSPSPRATASCTAASSIRPISAPNDVPDIAWHASDAHPNLWDDPDCRTIAYQLDGKRTYALEGAIFIAGAAVQWLRDGLKLVKTAGETGRLARAADPNQHVYLVPAFVGLGAPYWNAEARGAIFGLTRGTTEKELAQAALEAVCYQTRDLLEAMQKDMGGKAKTILRADGGMTASDWTMQRLADMLDAPVDRPVLLAVFLFVRMP